MKVKDLMTTNVICCGEDNSLKQVSGYMRKNNVGCIPVCDDKGHLKGIITDRDIVVRALATDKTGLHVSDIMTKGAVTIGPDLSIHEAALLFAAHKIRRLPITEASKIVGILTLGDLASKPVYIDEAGDALSAISLADGLQAEN